MEQNKKPKTIRVNHINVRTSIFFLLLKLVALDIIAASVTLAAFAFFFAPGIPDETKLIFISGNLYWFIIFITVKLTLTIFVVLQWLNEYYEITPEYVYYKKGIIFEKESRHEIVNVRSVQINQGILGKLCNFGTLILYDVRLNKRMQLYLIHNPHRYLRVFEEIMPKLEEEKEIIREKNLDISD